METYKINGLPSFGLLNQKGEQGAQGANISFEDNNRLKTNDTILYKNDDCISVGLLNEDKNIIKLYDLYFSKKPKYNIEIGENEITFDLIENRKVDLYICYRNSKNNYIKQQLTKDDTVYILPNDIQIDTTYAIYMDYYETNYYPNRTHKYLIYTNKKGS